MEIAAGKLAETRAQDPTVRTFGQQMVLDHTRIDHALRALADARQMTLPDALAAHDQAMLGRLETLTGAEFDRHYAQLMVKDHVQDIKEFDKAASGAQDADVKAFATNTLPTLRHHLLLAKQLAAQQSKGTSPRSTSPTPTSP